MNRLHLQCAAGHTAVPVGRLTDGRYHDLVDDDWRSRSSDGPAIRCPCGAPTSDIQLMPKEQQCQSF